MVLAALRSSGVDKRPYLDSWALVDGKSVARPHRPSEYGGAQRHRPPQQSRSSRSTFLDSLFGVGASNGADTNDVESEEQRQQPQLEAHKHQPSKLIRDRSWLEVPPVPIPAAGKSSRGDQELEEILVEMRLRLGPARVGGGAVGRGESDGHSFGGGVQEFVTERHHRKRTQFSRARDEVRNMLIEFWWRGSVLLDGSANQRLGATNPVGSEQQHALRSSSGLAASGEDERMRVIIGRPTTTTRGGIAEDSSYESRSDS
jgi:hypothetical protein